MVKRSRASSLADVEDGRQEGVPRFLLGLVRVGQRQVLRQAGVEEQVVEGGPQDAVAGQKTGGGFEAGTEVREPAAHLVVQLHQRVEFFEAADVEVGDARVRKRDLSEPELLEPDQVDSSGRRQNRTNVFLSEEQELFPEVSRSDRHDRRDRRRDR